MPDKPETDTFIRSTFRSVWSLELLLLLRSESDRRWAQEDLVVRMRGSDSVVRNGLAALIAAGLVVREDDGSVSYAPASPDLEAMVDRVQDLYARRPDAVRRVIVMGTHDQLNAFADSFRLRRD
jgi:hypothetical protein